MTRAICRTDPITLGDLQDALEELTDDVRNAIDGLPTDDSNNDLSWQMDNVELALSNLRNHVDDEFNSLNEKMDKLLSHLGIED